jgi:hypothetical protein
MRDSPARGEVSFGAGGGLGGPGADKVPRNGAYALC